MRNFSLFSRNIVRNLVRGRAGFTRSSTLSSSRNEKASREVVVGGADTSPSKPALLPFVRLVGQRDGFTILEMLVVVSVMTMLSGILVIYSRTSENQILLFKEQAKIVAALFRAKTLASQTFSETDPKPCAYGVALVGTEFYIFKDLPDPAFPNDCTTANKQFDGIVSDEVFEALPLDERLELNGTDTSFDEVIFIPPDPTTLLNRNPAVPLVQIVVNTAGAGSSLGVKINDAGQITSFRPI